MTNNFHHLKSGTKILSWAWVLGINTFKSLVQNFYNAVATKSGWTLEQAHIYLTIPPYTLKGGGANQRSNIMETEQVIFFICYRIFLHGIDLYGFGWELVWTYASSNATTWHLSEIAFSNTYWVCPLSFICHDNWELIIERKL